jgi:adenylate cyclase
MLQFEAYTLDIVRNVLRAGDREIAVRPKGFELLRYLVENADRLVTKQELFKAIWPNVAVSDESLTHCVSEVRQAIGDSEQAIIKTVPRRGYRFSAPVVRVATDAASPATAGEMPPRSAGETPTVPDRMGDRPSVAVLPFANLSGDPQEDYSSSSRAIQLFSTGAGRSISGRSGASLMHATSWRAASGAAATASASWRSSSMP